MNWDKFCPIPTQNKQGLAGRGPGRFTSTIEDTFSKAQGKCPFMLGPTPNRKTTFSPLLLSKEECSRGSRQPHIHQYL